MKIKPSRNGEITLSFIDIGKSCLNREFFTSLMCLLMLKFSRKFPNLHYAKVHGAFLRRFFTSFSLISMLVQQSIELAE